MARFDCVVCLGKDCVSSNGHNLSCWGIGCFDLWGRPWLDAVAAAVSEHDLGLIVSFPERYFPAATDSGKSDSRPSVRMRLADAPLDRWSGRLWSSERLAEDALRWLTEERLVSAKVIQRYGLGWNGSEIVLPLRRNGVVVGCKLRRPSRTSKTIAWPGLRVEDGAFPLYPALGPERSILLCEGELDALAARSAGIPACSVTLGVSRWLPEWTTTLARRRVAICFDVGAEEVAESRAALLRTARVIQLEGPDGYDITDFLREHSPRGLKQLLGVQCR
jgi:hypothetical protein